MNKRNSHHMRRDSVIEFVSDDIVSLIVNTEYKIFEDKVKVAYKKYANEKDETKQIKILLIFLTIASAYKTFLTNNFEDCDELFIESFTYFYFICKFVFIEKREYFIKNEQICDDYIKCMDNLSNNFTSFAESNVYFKSIETFASNLSNPIDNYALLSSPNFRRSLDPKSGEELVHSMNDFYPSDESGNDLNDGNIQNDSDSSSLYSENLPINTIDLETFASLSPQDYTILHARAKPTFSSTRDIVNIDPSFVHDTNYFSESIIPKIKHPENIIFFSESPVISELERSIIHQLHRFDLKQCFWLIGGDETYREARNSKNLHPKLPDLESLSMQPKRVESPPIPAAQSFLPLQKPASLPPSIPILSPSPNSLQQEKSLNQPSSRHPYLSLQPNLPYGGSNLMPSLPNINGSTHSHLSNLSKNGNALYYDRSVNSSFDYPNHTAQGFPQGQHLQIPQAQIPILQEPLVKISKFDYKPIVRLRNLGSTCYINSMIQCLFSIKKFRNFFIDDDKISFHEALSNNPDQKLTDGFHKMFESFYRETACRTIPPIMDMSKFLSIIARLNPEYNIPNEQQDTSQFLYYIVDQLHNELKTNFETAQENQLVKINQNDGKKYADWQINTLKSEGFSYIQNLFNIKEEVSLKCSRCGNESVRYDTSIMIHLNLNHKSTSLKDILCSNFKPEEMCEELGNAWDCDGCKEADKKLALLQDKTLKQYDAYVAEHNNNDKSKNKSKGHKEKNRETKLFSKKTFFKKSSKDNSNNKDSDREQTPDVQDFYMNTLTDHELEEFEKYTEIASRTRRAYRTVELVELPEVLVICFSLFDLNQQSNKVSLQQLVFPEVLPMEFGRVSEMYKLSSWTDHWGTSIDSGHYTAVVKHLQNEWINCDDDKVTKYPTQSKEIDDKNVYLLFYEKI